MTLIDGLNWRHATKAYDTTKKVSQEDLNKIVEAARLAPSSSGLQPFRLAVIADQGIKNQLAEGAFNPECMRECSHVLVFAAWDEYTEERIDTIYNKTTDERDMPRGRFDRYTDMIKNMYAQQTSEEHFTHAAKQAYIAFGLALAQAAELRIDSTPAEGFDNEVVDNVLQLKEKGLRSVLVLYLGYRDEERDWLAPMKKVRNDIADFVLTY
ncbi:NAD(P)H-dependent oxidoreductase [Sphingobacterium deserti]|uniref:Nitroreductase/dihydropteridine reductase n=1 Tax=Sphingobacterium deserti TaxID=1229276 RepID=A0A0B8T3L6_9SPHI|nr:NAD(P)H-dependent oxidoreductase [Sphingobacterium deserti]KGE16147.1 nitroreductase/dihydropteridine reductase [Sphingobacterium deserti]